MNPSREQIEKWAKVTEDGWVCIPASCWPDLLWCIGEAERIEALYLAQQKVTHTATGTPVGSDKT